MLAAGLTGKDALTALNSAQMVEYYNRQLHPVEAKRIEKIAGEYAEKRGISIDKAIAELTQQVEQNIDTAWNKRLGSDNPTAQAFLKENGLGQPLVDPATGQTYQLFTADAAQRDNHAQFAQYSKSDPLVRKELDLAMSKAYLPSDAQAIKAPMTGSDMALNDAARDFANMKAQPASVQWSVLAELRGTRVVVMQQYAGLSDELKNLPLTPDNAQRRTDLTIQLDSLGQRDAALLGATKQQILDMGAAGSANPLNQRETYEGMGEALGLARLSGKGISNASINARIDLLKGAIAEAQAASAAEKAVAVRSFTFNAIENPGPLASLPGNPAANFFGGKYNQTILTDDLVLYRGGEAGKPLGQWFAREAPQSVAEIRIDSAVKPQWVDPSTGVLTGTSKIDTMYEIRIPKGTIIYEGPVGYQGGIYLGGPSTNQVFVQTPWNTKGVQVLNSTPIQ